MKNKNTISFTQHCMTQLLSTTPSGSDMPEISGEDLTRIHNILRKYKPKKERNIIKGVSFSG